MCADAHARVCVCAAQAYRKKALELHPDKRKATQREGARSTRSCKARRTLRFEASVATLTRVCACAPAAAAEREFNSLQKAYDLLWCAATLRRHAHAAHTRIATLSSRVGAANANAPRVPT